VARGRADGRRIVDLSATIDTVTPDRSGRRAVFVNGIAVGASEQEVRAFFETAGTVEAVKLWRDHRGGQQLGVITFQYPLDAKRGLATLHRAEFRGRVLTLAYAR
jgi:hypothetical protein